VYDIRQMAVKLKTPQCEQCAKRHGGKAKHRRHRQRWS